MEHASARSEDSKTPLLVMRNVVKNFGEVLAVDDVSVVINQGEIFALLGSSGCGKSTLLRLLAGFEMPTSGQILLAGRDIVSVPPYQRSINMMFQSYALFPHLSVWENVAFGLYRDGISKDEIHERVAAMLRLVQLQSYGKRKPHQLSGGQQQRVALARSLVKRPQLLLLDEPLGALDKKLREQTQLELVNIIESVGVTCVMVTHDQEEAMAMASRIAVMNEGRILQIGRPTEVYETPNCRLVADFIGNVNLFSGVVVESRVNHVLIDSPECRHYVEREIAGTIGMSVWVGIRPEKMSIQVVLDQAVSPLEANCVMGEVHDLAYLGSYTAYHVRLTTGMMLKIAVTNKARHVVGQPKLGDQVCVTWSGDDAVVLMQ